MFILQTSNSIPTDYCDTDNTNSPLQGIEPVSATALLTFDGVVVTSLAVDVIDKFTVAYIGTSNGVLHQVRTVGV